MIDLQMMAQKLSQRSNHREEEWHSVLNAAIHDPAFTQMTDGEIDLLMNSMQSPQQLNWLLELFRDSYMKVTDEMPFDFVIRHVNQSGKPLQTWLEALHEVYQQNQKTKKPVELKVILHQVDQSFQAKD